MFLHIDCNSYFASCEIATNPSLVGKPVVVCSNDEGGGGIVLALNAEAKALGLKRGRPLFQVRDILKNNHVELCVADHKKYHRISRQIMDCVRQQDIVLNFVQYSVDEFFGELPLDNPDELRHYTAMVRDHITQTTHIPVGCGCASSYTLAKVATYYAKRYKGYDGICVLTDDKREKALSLLPVEEVWGVGRKLRVKLRAEGFNTALDFANADERRIKELLGTPGYRTYRELNGHPCIDLDRSEQQGTISRSRTFAYMIEDKEALKEQILGFVTDCAFRLRQQKSLCSSISCFVATNRHRTDLLQYSNGATIKFPAPTCDTTIMVKAATKLVNGLYRPGYKFKQAGITLGDISASEGQQLDLFTSEEDAKRQRLMKITDLINSKFGADTVDFGGTLNSHKRPSKE